MADPLKNFAWGTRTYIMGVLNVTPDSFSDGGEHDDPGAALVRAREMVAHGADIIDVGGESTRPGGEPVSEDEEWSRVRPVLEALKGELSVPISIDTYKASVAEKALSTGAAVVNDVWGLQRDPRMAKVVAEHGAWVVVMHNQHDASYRNLMEDIVEKLQHSIDRALQAGVARDRIIIDPGFGFAKAVDENLELAARLAELQRMGLPILYGPSRKTTIGHVLNLPVSQRLEGTAALVALAVAAGVDMVRVHDVQAMARVARMTDAVVRQGAPVPCTLVPAAQHQAGSAASAAAVRDRIHVRGIPGFGHHGVLDAERQSGQPFTVDLELELDLHAAGAADDLTQTVDYGEIYQRVRELIEGEPVALLERLAHRITVFLLRTYPLQAVRVTVHKPRAPLPGPFSDVAVEIYRSSQDVSP